MKISEIEVQKILDNVLVETTTRYAMSKIKSF